MPVKTQCIVCGGPVFTRPSRAKVGRGKFCSRKCYYEYGRPLIRGANHHLWKADSVSYHAIHKWVIRYLGQPNECENCGTTDAAAFDWANISGEYRRDLSDWARLCRSCHHLIDGTGYKSWVTRKANK